MPPEKELSAERADALVDRVFTSAFELSQSDHAYIGWPLLDALAATGWLLPNDEAASSPARLAEMAEQLISAPPEHERLWLYGGFRAFEVSRFDPEEASRIWIILSDLHPRVAREVVDAVSDAFDDEAAGDRIYDPEEFTPQMVEFYDKVMSRNPTQT